MFAPRNSSTRAPFRRYSAYVDRIHGLLAAPATSQWVVQANASLNGEASAQLRALAGLATRRKFGAFFTGTNLSDRLLKLARSTMPGLTYDPTCGMGDLLLAAARRLPLGSSLKDTLRQWGACLAGTDLHSEFITGTKTRLVLLARQRHALADASPVLTLDGLFPLILVGDGLRTKAMYARADRLLVNPPFGATRASRDCEWAEGKVSRAAGFIMHAVEQMRGGAELLAILPDVLRSGSFSAQWRRRIGELAEVHYVKAYGLFDESADVDVFLLRLVRRTNEESRSRKLWPTSRVRKTGTLSDHFSVSVGRVVPHRDPEDGPLLPYIHPRGVPAWQTLQRFSEYRRHPAAPFRAPFVVIRRTSRPEHPFRATASIIGGKMKIAVENHLFVCTPHDGTLRSCRELLRQLQLPRVNAALNRRIRCRHLTVGAVREIPFTPTRKVRFRS